MLRLESQNLYCSTPYAIQYNNPVIHPPFLLKEMLIVLLDAVVCHAVALHYIEVFLLFC